MLISLDQVGGSANSYITERNEEMVKSGKYRQMLPFICHWENIGNYADM